MLFLYIGLLFVLGRRYRAEGFVAPPCRTKVLSTSAAPRLRPDIGVGVVAFVVFFASQARSGSHGRSG